MSDFVFRLSLQSILSKPHADEAIRFRQLSGLVSRRLEAMIETMEDRGYHFEAREAEDLAIRFEAFSEGESGCFEFSRYWDDLCNWAESTVPSGRREKSLCSIPTLPIEFSC